MCIGFFPFPQCGETFTLSERRLTGTDRLNAALVQLLIYRLPALELLNPIDCQQPPADYLLSIRR